MTARIDGRVVRQRIDALTVAGVVAPSFYTYAPGDRHGTRWVITTPSVQRVYTTREASAFATGADAVRDTLRDTYRAARTLADGEAVDACAVMLAALAPLFPDAEPMTWDDAYRLLGDVDLDAHPATGDTAGGAS